MATMTREEFINREVRVWGEDYIFDLLDRGYEPILLTNPQTTQTRWSWVLTNSPFCATVRDGCNDGGLLPFSLAFRASDG